MVRELRLGATLLLLIAVLACSGGAGDAGRGHEVAAQGQQQATARRSITMAISREPSSLEPSLQPQNAEWSTLGSAFLAYFSPETHGAIGYLAEELPSLDKGTWRVLPDGRMETTYRLKNATWHDGEPITAHDFVFGWTARTDPRVPVYSADVERKIARATAIDDRTLLLEWAEPYLWAGMVHLPDFSPMPSHTLEALYRDDRAAFVDGPQWREGFVGSGPFRIVAWDPGVDIVFAAHDGFVLGKPGLDEIRLRFMGESNTIVSNLLGGSLDAAFSIAIGFPEGQSLEHAGWTGKVDYWASSGSPRYLEYQARDWGNTQPAVFDQRVRRASHYAINRQSIVDEIYAGRAKVAYFWLSPIDPVFPTVDRAVTKYDFDPIRATALLGESGWTKGPDGMLRNAAGQPLALTILNTPTEADAVEAAVIVDNWRSVGITADIHRLSPQEIRDNELRSKFVGVTYNRRNLTLDNMSWLSSNVSQPDNRWAGSNRSGYTNPRLDDLWGRVLGSVDERERGDWLVQALQTMMDDAMVVLTHITPNVMAYDRDLVGPAEPVVVETSRIWNIWEWHWK